MNACSVPFVFEAYRFTAVTPSIMQLLQSGNARYCKPCMAPFNPKRTGLPSNTQGRAQCPECKGYDTCRT